VQIFKKDQQAGTVHPTQIDPKRKKENGTTTTVTSNDESVS